VVVVVEEEVVEVRQLKKCRMNMAIADYIVTLKFTLTVTRRPRWRWRWRWRWRS
jgi:hypothetical protein